MQQDYRMDEDVTIVHRRTESDRKRTQCGLTKDHVASRGDVILYKPDERGNMILCDSCWKPYKEVNPWNK